MWERLQNQLSRGLPLSIPLARNTPSYQETSKPVATPSEQQQLDKKLLDKATAPIQAGLDQITTAIREQASRSALQQETLKAVAGDVSNVRESVQKMQHKVPLAYELAECCPRVVIGYQMLTSLPHRATRLPNAAIRVMTRSWARQTRLALRSNRLKRDLVVWRSSSRASQAAWANWCKRATKPKAAASVVRSSQGRLQNIGNRSARLAKLHPSRYGNEMASRATATTGTKCTAAASIARCC